MVLEIFAAVGGSIAFAKYLGPFLYQECFAPASDDDLLLNAGLFPTDRTPLLGGNAYPSPSPRADSLRLAAELYDGHLEDWVARQRGPASSAGGSTTPGATTDASGANTPLSVSTPPESAASSYFDLRQPPLYINDVQVALEKETKRRNSNDLARANVLAGFHMASRATSGLDTPNDDTLMMKRPSLTRRFSNASTPGLKSSKPFSDENAYLTSSLVCLLHCPDLSQFFLSGEYLDEEVDSPYHRAVIDAFASTAQFFWPPANEKPLSTPALDLSIFQAILSKTTPSATAAPTPLSSSPVSSAPLSSSPVSTLVNSATNSSPATLTGVQTVSHLLRSLHIALNEGAYTSDQPTYLRSPYQLSSGEGLRQHAGFLRNMQRIQEDSIVRDVFEGLVCVTSQCECEEGTARFDAFSVLPLPNVPGAGNGKKPTLKSLLKEYERPTASVAPQWCNACGTYTQHTETRKIWSLPSTIIFQLPSSTPFTSTSSTPSPSRPNSPHPIVRRLSRSYSTSAPPTMTPLTSTQPLQPTTTPVEYPIDTLDLSSFNGEARSHTSTTSLSMCDLSSDSGDDAELQQPLPDDGDSDEQEETYDLFAVRESVRGTKYRVFAKDPVEDAKWAVFDANTGVSREVRDLREVVTPNADLLFYRRRE